MMAVEKQSGSGTLTHAGNESNSSAGRIEIVDEVVIGNNDCVDTRIESLESAIPPCEQSVAHF